MSNESSLEVGETGSKEQESEPTDEVNTTSSFESETIESDYIAGVNPDQVPDDGLMFQRKG